MKKLNIKKLGNDLRVKRAEYDHSQSTAASIIGTTQPVVASIENKRRENFKFNTILAVSDYVCKPLTDYVI